MKTLVLKIYNFLFKEKTEAQLIKKMESLHSKFCAYLHYQHTRYGYLNALKEKEYSRETFLKIYSMKNETLRLAAIKEHINYLRMLNRRGPQ